MALSHSPGDQHNNVATSNPFDEPKQRISEFTAQEIATLQSRLDQQLGPEYLSSRPGPGNKKIHYITAEKIIQLANEVFGFNGWSSSIRDVQVDFVEENTNKMTISLGLSVIVRVTLRDGTFHEDIGYGSIDNCKGKAAAFEKAKKEGTTDGLKRALRSFGNVLGNCIYDKTYLTNVTKMKVASSKFDHGKLYRHSDYAPVKKEEPTQPTQTANTALPLREEQTLPPLTAAETEDLDLMVELDDADFCVSEEGHPDEVAIPDNQNNKSQNGQHSSTTTATSSSTASNPAPPQNQNFRASTGSMQPPQRQMGRSVSGPPPRQPHAPNQGPPPHPGRPQGHLDMQNGRLQQGSNSRPPPPGHNSTGVSNAPNGNRNSIGGPPSRHHQQSAAPQQQHQQQPGQQGGAQKAPPVGGGEVGFFSARGVIPVKDGKEAPPVQILANAPRFDPKHESPSIRKTPGIDHNSSKPVARNGTHVPSSVQSAGKESGTNAPTGGSGGIPAPGRPGSGMGGGFSGGTSGFKAPTPRGGHQRQQQQQQDTGGGNVVNPHMNHARTIGAPGGSASPLANRGQYRPPLKRPLLSEPGMGRPALQDVSNNPTAGASTGDQDVKRVKMR